MNEDAFNDLLLLSGLNYHGYKYDCDYWINKTGVDPAKYPRYVDIRKNGLVGSKQAYLEFMEAYRNNIRLNWGMIGIAS